MVWRKKHEEPTAKDSMIEHQKHTFNHLYELYKKLMSDYRETLRENFSLKTKIAQLEGKLEAWEDIEKKKKNKLIYDGNQQY